MLATIIFFILFFIAWYLFHFTIKPRLKFAKIINKLPGAPTYPLMGNSYVFFGIPGHEIFKQICEYLKTYGPLCRNWIGGMPIVHVGKPHNIELVLKSSVNINKGKMYDILRPWLGEGILLSTGRKWYHRRELLIPAFHFQILEKFIEIFQEQSEKLVDALGEYANGEVFDIYPIVSGSVLDIVSETVMNVNAMTTSQSSDYGDAMSKLCELLVMQYLKPWRRILFLPFFSYGKEMARCLSTAHTFVDEVIRERKLSLASNIRKIGDFFGKKRRISFLDILLETIIDGIGLSDTEIREEINTLMFGAHHTTAVSVCWTLFLLGKNPYIQQKAYKEIKSILQDEEKSLRTEDLNKMKYLECVIKESLRLYPSVPIILRQLSEDMYLDGYLIPKKCQVALHIYDVHRDPEFWDNPNEFDPTRFYPLNSVNRHPYSYIPFSAGKRNCAGQKFALIAEKVILIWVLKNFKVISLSSVEDVKPTFEIILKPSDGVKIKLEKRNQ